VLIFAGSTAALTTIEYESGVIGDLEEATRKARAREPALPARCPLGRRQRLLPCEGGHAGPSLTIPVIEGKLVLGTWQQVILCDFDNRPRRRQVVVQGNR